MKGALKPRSPRRAGIRLQTSGPVYPGDDSATPQGGLRSSGPILPTDDVATIGGILTSGPIAPGEPPANIVGMTSGPIVPEDEPESEEDQYPDLPPGEAYLLDEDGRYLLDEDGRRLIVDAPVADRRTRDTASEDDLRRELLSRIESLEAALQTYQVNLPPRNHNHPPELVEPDPLPPHEVRIVVEVTAELKLEAQRPQPDPSKLTAQASILRRAARLVLAWLWRKADAAVDSAIKWAVPLVGAWAIANPEKVAATLAAAAEAATALAHYFS